MLVLTVNAIVMLAGIDLPSSGAPTHEPHPIALAAPQNGGARPIEGDALRALLRDAFVSRPVSPGVVTHPSGEVFRQNGVYERVAHWRKEEGTFSIERDSVCIQGPRIARQCRRMALLRDGTYSFVDTEDGSSAIMHVDRLEPAGAETPLATPPPLDRLRRLGGDEIRTAFAGHSFLLDRVSYGPPQLMDRVLEWFGEDGEMRRMVGHAITTGRWDVRGNLLCMSETGVRESCRAMFEDATGKLFIIRREDRTGTPFPLTRQ